MKVAPILSFDWLQLNVSSEVSIDFKYHGFFQVKVLPISTRHFKLVEEIYRNGKRIATIQRVPLSPIIKANTVLIKFDNWVLYSFDLLPYVREFLALNQFKFHNISRLDVCADFTKFDNGLQPSEFIKSYLYNHYLRLGRTSSGNSYFKQKKNEMQFSSLKFGSNLSEVSCYLYNKTLEMSTIKWKPWIAKKWKLAGIEENNDVWRLEVSLKSSAKALVNIQSSEVQSLNDLNILALENLPMLFGSFRDKYFSFVIKDSQVKKSRMKPLKLFADSYSDIIIIKNQNQISSNRADKIFIKKLHEVNADLREKNFLLSIDIDSLKMQYIDIAGLNNWAIHKELINP